MPDSMPKPTLVNFLDPGVLNPGAVNAASVV